MMPCIAVRSSTTPPNTGTEAPRDSASPAAGVTGTPLVEQAANTAATCSAVVGRHTAPARRATAPASDQCIASGHQSRLASAVSASDVMVSQMRRAGRSARRRAGASAPVNRERRCPSARSAPSALSPIDPEQVGLGGLAGRLLERTRVAEVGDLAVDLGVVPTHVGGDQPGDVGGGSHRGRPVEEAGAGAARQHVVERDGHLGSRRVDGLGLDVRKARARAVRRGVGRRDAAP